MTQFINKSCLLSVLLFSLIIDDCRQNIQNIKLNLSFYNSETTALHFSPALNQSASNAYRPMPIESTSDLVALCDQELLIKGLNLAETDSTA